MSLDITQLDDTILARKTAEPLRFAFEKKTSAHAGGMSRPANPETFASLSHTLFEDDTRSDGRRCLYIHIPFCRVRCTFCNFFQNAASQKLVDEYFDALMQELKEKASLPWTRSGQFHAVYIGGGTPTDLSADQVMALGQAIRDLFPLSADCEITLEGRINRFSDEMFDKALRGGFNRFSFGIQSFNTKVRRSAKRLDDREDVMARVKELAQADSAPIILDLLYGLPYQTMDVFRQDLDDYLETGAHGVDLYQLVVGGSAPMINLVEKGKLAPPAETPDKALMYQLGVNYMAEHHLKQLSVNHWAIDNRERSLYNSLAKTSAQVLPIGCGAGGSVSGYSMMHQRNLEAYVTAIKNGKSPLMMMAKQHPLEPLFASIKAGFDRGVLCRRNVPDIFGQSTFDWLKPLFSVWQERGLLRLETNSAELTLAGSFWSVTLAQTSIRVLTTYFNEQRAIA